MRSTEGFRLRALMGIHIKAITARRCGRRRSQRMRQFEKNEKIARLEAISRGLYSGSLSVTTALMTELRRLRRELGLEEVQA